MIDDKMRYPQFTRWFKNNHVAPVSLEPKAT